MPDSDHPKILAWPPLIFALCLGIGLGLHGVLRDSLGSAKSMRLAGALLSFTAGAIAISASRAMRRADTPVRPDKPTRAIVTSGPYRYTRNPLYLSLCLLNLGIGLCTCGLAPVLMTVCLVLVLHHGVILPEEKYLAAKFGRPYLDYCRGVRRWL